MVRIKKLSKTNKIKILMLLCAITIVLTVGIPSLARYKNRNTLTESTSWDGTIASKYRKGNGTVENPYIISNGQELAHFYTNLQTTDYENTYFELKNDIVLNEGILTYDETNKVQYKIGNNTYYVKPYTNEYYDNIEYNNTCIGTINTFNPLNNFKGNFKGNSYTIYGLYMTNSNSEQLALFTNLNGDISDLYVNNAVIYGGVKTAGIASTTKSKTLKNIVFSGYVVGSETEQTKTENINIENKTINITTEEMTDTINIENIPYINGEIVGATLTGTISFPIIDENETQIKINKTAVTNGNFEINIPISSANNVNIKTQSEENITATITNLQYNITYKYAVASGIIAESENTQIENCINKGNIYGKILSSGIVGYTNGQTNIKRVYNTGEITSSNTASGLIGSINQNNQMGTVTKSYNKGVIEGQNKSNFIGLIENNTQEINITKSFAVDTENYNILKIDASTVNINDSYNLGALNIQIGIATGSFELVTEENLNTKNYMITNLEYNEYVNETDRQTNLENVWVYETGKTPILYIDDISDPIANIHMDNKTWNNLSYELNTFKKDQALTFNIEQVNELKPIREKYYYISSTKLTKNELLEIPNWDPNTQNTLNNSWIPYTNLVELTQEGEYTIYAKIVDYNNNVTYINTDHYVIDLTASTININMDDKNWTTYNQTPNYTYIDENKNITITAQDELSGIEYIKYYLTSSSLTELELSQLNETVWMDYSEPIQITETGKYILYAKVMDECGHETIINTDYIKYEGYTQEQLLIGRNNQNSDTNSITNTSLIAIKTNYTDEYGYNNYKHNIISNILLPYKTKILVFNKVNNRKYEYKVETSTDIYNFENSCQSLENCQKRATYPLILFNEVGTTEDKKYFNESSYYKENNISENFEIIVDFNETDISTNYENVSIYMQLTDQSNNIKRTTLKNTMKTFNVYSNTQSAHLFLTSDNSSQTITLNSNSTTNISLNTGVNYGYIGTTKIADTTLDDKDIGLEIKLVDGENNTITKDKYKNIIFKIDDKEYYPNSNNITRINLENGINQMTKELQIVTSSDNTTLNEGNYYFKVSAYTSYDGVYNKQNQTQEITIPVNVIKTRYNDIYNFKVLTNNTPRIIDKTDETKKNISFSIIQNGQLENPNIRVELYKKKNNIATNQEYEKINLQEYCEEILTPNINNIYFVTQNPIAYENTTETYNVFNLTLKLNQFESNGYKFIFSLYDGERKVGTEEKTFIIK